MIGPLALLLAGWSFWNKAQQPNGRCGFLLGLLLLTGRVVPNADLGARLVFVEGAGVKAAVPLMIEGHDHGHDSAEHPERHDLPDQIPHHAEFFAWDRFLIDNHLLGNYHTNW